jgi:hypothetical protein
MLVTGWESFKVSKQFSGRERTRPRTRRQREALSSMDEFDRRGCDLTTLLDSAARLLVWALNVKFCQLVQYAGDRRSLILRAGAGWRNETAAGRDTMIEAGVGSFAGFTLISNRATTFEALADQHGFRPSPMLTDHHVVSGAGVVIGGASSPFGAICVFSDRPHHFDTHDLAFLRSAAGIILHAAQSQNESRRHEDTTFVQPKAACSCNGSGGSRNLNVGTDLSPLGAPFSANVSHEIRTPLNIILGYSELIEEQLAAKGCAELAPYVDAVRRAGERLLHTVEEILDLSKIGTDSLELKPVEFFLGPMLKEIVGDFQPTARVKGLNLTLDLQAPRARVRFDKYCLERTLTSLLHNAVKFTERGSIEVRLSHDAAGGLKLDVRDTGIGIDKSYMPHLFQPFSQEDSSYSRRFEGAGLGLALCRRYLELNGATFDVQSTKNVGTTCTIDFRARALPDFGLLMRGVSEATFAAAPVEAEWTPRHFPTVPSPSIPSRLNHR